MALGKGLSSLIPEKRRKQEKEHSHQRGSEHVFLVDIDRIVPNAEQPRSNFDQTSLEELAGSIREHGILQPLVVMKREEERATGRDVYYEIIAGERRWRASQLAGLPRIPVIVRKPKDNEKLEIALVENLQRDDLNAIEEAQAYRRLMDTFGMTQEAIAARVGRSRPSVANVVRLLELPADIQRAVREGTVSGGHARALLACSSTKDQQAMFAAIVRKGLTVRDVERRIKSMGAPSRPPQKKMAADSFLSALEEELSQALGTNVAVTKGRSGGKITISYYSNEELESVRKKLLE